MKIQGRQDFTKPFSVNVWVDERKLYSDYSRKVFNHSPTGFNWGYAGSGPAQLALALLLLVTNEEVAMRQHQSFKNEFIVTLPQGESFDAEIDIVSWLVNKQEVVYTGINTRGFSGKEEDGIGDCSFPDRCQKADWPYCDCSCGGVNHGVQRKLPIFNI